MRRRRVERCEGHGPFVLVAGVVFRASRTFSCVPARHRQRKSRLGDRKHEVTHLLPMAGNSLGPCQCQRCPRAGGIGCWCEVWTTLFAGSLGSTAATQVPRTEVRQALVVVVNVHQKCIIIVTGASPKRGASRNPTAGQTQPHRCQRVSYRCYSTSRRFGESPNRIFALVWRRALAFNGPGALLRVISFLACCEKASRCCSRTSGAALRWGSKKWSDPSAIRPRILEQPHPQPHHRHIALRQLRGERFRGLELPISETDS